MTTDLEYAGFWIRVLASIIDSILIVLIIWPLLSMIYGADYWRGGELVRGTWDFLLSWLFPAVAAIVFWVYRSATPGKMALRLVIVDAGTGNKPSLAQFVIRYLGYFVSTLPLFLGLIWVGIDARKQGWHDKIARTVVIRNKHKPAVSFTGK